MYCFAYIRSMCLMLYEREAIHLLNYLEAAASRRSR